MQWLNLEMCTLDNEDFGCADSLEWGIWLKLMRYCCVQENRGRIKAATAWDDKKIQWVLRVQKADLDRKSTLWEWKGDDLMVHFFPTEKLAEVKRLRSQASSAAKIRWGNANPTRDARRMPQGIPSGMPDAMQNDAERNAERKGKERKGKEENSARSLVASNPPSREGVIAFFSAEGSTVELGSDFFDTYAANGWTQGGRPEAPLVDWQPEARKWIRRATAKKSLEGGAGGGAVVPFDPKTPHAHTGGIPPAN